MVMELLLADQPARAEAHDRSSQFWAMADLQRVDASRFPPRPAEQVPLLDDSHVAMRVNLDACIHCNLCVRACREVQVNDVIGMAGRGLDELPSSTWPTRWAPRPASPAANACRPARPAR